MNEIQSTLNLHLPPNKKTTPSGWISFNAVCCHHNGESRDTRNRGGILITSDGFQYHCFNCNFKAGWTEGKLLGGSTKKLLAWLGVNDSEINRLSLYSLRMKDSVAATEKKINIDLEERSLPEGSVDIQKYWADPDEPLQVKIRHAMKIVVDRRLSMVHYQWHYSPNPGFEDRLIIPFYQNRKIVGWTARKITDGKPKYITDSQPGYVFNMDRQIASKKFVIVTEGPFDAIAVDGVAILGNEPNETQIHRINSLGKEVIVVPDRDIPGLKLIDHAIEQGWSVSCPPWRENIKDVSDAHAEYEELYTLYSILHYRESNKLKLELLKKQQKRIIESIEQIKKGTV